MLVPPFLSTDVSTLPVVEAWAPYAYLLGEVNPQLSTATCLYFDGASSEWDLVQILDLVESWFGRFESKPKVVMVGGDKQILSGRYSMRTLRESASDRKVVGGD